MGIQGLFDTEWRGDDMMEYSDRLRWARGAFSYHLPADLEGQIMLGITSNHSNQSTALKED